MDMANVMYSPEVKHKIVQSCNNAWNLAPKMHLKVEKSNWLGDMRKSIHVQIISPGGQS